MIKLIACIGPNGELGKHNDLIYDNKEDMVFFRATTLNKVVLMGQNTFKSLGSKPLPKRTNIVLAERPLDNNDITQYIGMSLEKALLCAQRKASDDDVYVIGGAYVYNQVIEKKLADELLLTIMFEEADADVFINLTTVMANYEIVETIDFIKDNEGKDIVGTIIKFRRR